MEYADGIDEDIIKANSNVMTAKTSISRAGNRVGNCNANISGNESTKRNICDDDQETRKSK